MVETIRLVKTHNYGYGSVIEHAPIVAQPWAQTHTENKQASKSIHLLLPEMHLQYKDQGR